MQSNKFTSAPSLAKRDLDNESTETVARTESTTCLSDFSIESCDFGTQVQPHVGYKKILITGGAGFIGSHVADFVLARGDDVVIVDEMNDYYDVSIKRNNISYLKEKYPASGRVQFFQGDICDVEFITSVFEDECPEWVCHMAARAGVRPSIADPYVYIHSNIKGTTQLMELSHRFGVKNFVFASSSSVYGGSKSTFFSEEESVDQPVSPYAASKKACELLAYTYHHLYNLNISALRFFTVYGPRGRPDMAPFKFIDRISRGMEIQQFGNGSSSRDYTFISDIVDGVVRAIDRPHKYEVFNLGKGSGTSLKDFLNLVQKHVGKKALIKVLPDQAGDVPYTCADVSKAYKMLGYKSKVTFEDGIRMTAEWYKKTYPQDNEIEMGPETQANGFVRSPLFVEVQKIAPVSS
jgi:UDP-glucuronate 4-epimerase